MIYFYLIILFSIVCSIFILSPIYKQIFSDSDSNGLLQDTPEKKAYRDLLESKEIVLNEIRDIDFDYGLGKLTKDDYTELRNRYRYRAAVILEQIRELEKAHGFEDRGV